MWGQSERLAPHLGPLVSTLKRVQTRLLFLDPDGESPLSTDVARRRRALGERDGWSCRYCDIDLARDDQQVWESHAPCPYYCPPDCPGGSMSPPPGMGFAIVEHVIPRCRGGANSLGNLVLSCIECNAKKGTHLLSELPAGWWR